MGTTSPNGEAVPRRSAPREPPSPSKARHGHRRASRGHDIARDPAGYPETLEPLSAYEDRKARGAIRVIWVRTMVQEPVRPHEPWIAVLSRYLLNPDPLFDGFERFLEAVASHWILELVVLSYCPGTIALSARS